MEVREKDFAKATEHTRQQFLKMWMDVLPAAKGTVNLSGRVSRMQATGSGHWGLLPTHATDFGPDPEFLGPGSSMLCGSDVIAAEVEEVIDLIVG